MKPIDEMSLEEALALEAFASKKAGLPWEQLHAEMMKDPRGGPAAWAERLKREPAPLATMALCHYRIEALRTQS